MTEEKKERTFTLGELDCAVIIKFNDEGNVYITMDIPTMQDDEEVPKTVVMATRVQIALSHPHVAEMVEQIMVSELQKQDNILVTKQ